LREEKSTSAKYGWAQLRKVKPRRFVSAMTEWWREDRFVTRRGRVATKKTTASTPAVPRSRRRVARSSARRRFQNRASAVSAGPKKK
jgi:hypothetical protein